MRRTGDLARWVALLAVLAPALALAEVEFYQTVDRTEVGTEDTFQLTIVVGGAPDGAQIQFPAPEDFEVLSRSQSTQMSYSFGGGGSGVIKRVQKWVLVMRANRAGQLSIPPAALTTAGRTYQTEPVKMQVKKGRLSEPQAARPGRLPDPFQNFPGFGFPDELDEPLGFPDLDIPRSDSDLFIKSYLDKDTLYVGEQATLSVYIFSRGDLSSVDTVNMPKLDGFWSEDLDSPSQLVGEQRVLGGVPYRAYLLKRRALFPVKPGLISIGPVEADITTGFVLTGRRVHRQGNALELTVKPLPPGGPAPVPSSSVGRWRLSTEVSATQVTLGEPLTVKVILEGRGNLKNLSGPSLAGPPSLRIYDPTTTDKVSNQRGELGGRRVSEYLVMPQQTGTFTLPGLTFDFFDPAARRYDSSRTDPITLTVLPGAGGSTGLTGTGRTPLDDSAPKNKLEATGLRPLRYQARFAGASAPLFTRPYFLPIAVAAPSLFFAALLAGWVRAALSGEDASTRKRKQARAARARLAAAEKLKATGRPDQFYGEVERALLSFLEAKLGAPVTGLTRDKLAELMKAAGLAEERTRQVLSALESCEAGRYAPGAGGVRSQLLEEAAGAMEGWDLR